MPAQILPHGAQPPALLALEIRLAEMDVAMALMKKGPAPATGGTMAGMPGMSHPAASGS